MCLKFVSAPARALGFPFIGIYAHRTARTPVVYAASHTYCASLSFHCIIARERARARFRLATSRPNGAQPNCRLCASYKCTPHSQCAIASDWRVDFETHTHTIASTSLHQRQKRRRQKTPLHHHHHHHITLPLRFQLCNGDDDDNGEGRPESHCPYHNTAEREM